MPVRFTILPLIAALLAWASPASAARVTPDQNATGRAIVLRALSLIKVEDMDFGWLTATSAGTATINPLTGAVTSTGGVVAVGGSPQAAWFVGAASRNTPIKIRIPNKPITLTRIGGTETMSLSAWTLDGPADRKTGIDRAFNFKVGGTLTVASGQADGVYEGTFTVDVQYP
jgi:hypothetical protein